MLTLLLVEDDIYAVELFKLAIQKMRFKCEVLHVKDGLEAVDYMLNQPMPDLIVTDLRMPRMTGQELISWVRTNVSAPRVPILVLSCHSEPNLDNELKKLGADEYLSKFSSLNELKSALRRHAFNLAPVEAPFQASTFL